MTTPLPSVRLKRYTPGLNQPAHSHDAPHLSLVLAGGFEERAGVEMWTRTGCVALRPEGLRHAVTFGPAGSLVLTFTPPDSEGAAAIPEPLWSPTLPRAQLRRLVPILLEGGVDAMDAGWDLIALASGVATSRVADPWIQTVRERLIDAPGETRLAALASQAGRHRVQVSRAFTAAYGEPPSVFRRRMMVGQALALTACGGRPAVAAAEAGFADQSHFSRACRDVWGMAPRRLLRPAD